VFRHKIQLEVDVLITNLAQLPGYSKVTFTNPNMEDELTLIARDTSVATTIEALDVSLSGGVKSVLGLLHSFKY
jgi:hypothetical protein